MKILGIVALGFLKNSAQVPMRSISSLDDRLMNKPSHSTVHGSTVQS